MRDARLGARVRAARGRGRVWVTTRGRLGFGLGPLDVEPSIPHSLRSSDGTEIIVSNPEKLQADANPIPIPYPSPNPNPNPNPNPDPHQADVIPVYFRHGQARRMRRSA